MDIHCPTIFLLATILFRGTNANTIPGWQPNYLDSFRFIPILGDCYQLYHRNDLTSSCRREPDLVNQSCIQWVSRDHECLGLVTPTNETLTFTCTSHIRFDTCFEVHDVNQNVSIVCQETIESRGVGVTTPDNFTVIFHDSNCRTATNIIERQIYANFMNNFSLDVEVRSCYKVYNSGEEITPYNCLSRTVYETCVFGMKGGCTALMTQNNEVLVLDCPEESQRPKQQDCFYLYTPDNQVHTVCQNKVEERCVGVVTPSNLTVLFECFFCSESMKFIYYNQEKQRKHRQFVKSYLENEYLGRNPPLLDLEYKLLTDNKGSSTSSSIYSYWIPKTSCLGVTLATNETILLECMVSKEKQEPGCFRLITVENEKQSLCSKVLNEACVGITTPKNWSVALACYGIGKNYNTLNNGPEWLFILHELKNFVNNRYKFHVGDYYEAYRENETNHRYRYQVQKLDTESNCVGLLTDTEVILLSCADGIIEQNGCFNVSKRENKINNEVSDSNMQVEIVCVKVLDGQCVGIITPDTWVILYSCAPPVSYVSQYEAGQTAVGFITGHIPSKLPMRLKRDERVCVTKLSESCVGLNIQNETVITLSCDLSSRPPAAGVFTNIPKNGPPEL